MEEEIMEEEIMEEEIVVEEAAVQEIVEIKPTLELRVSVTVGVR